MSEYDVFISYSRSDGSEHANTIGRLCKRHDMAAYMDTTAPPRPGSVLPEELRNRIIESRFFVPVLTRHYIKSGWTQQEYEVAKSHEKPIVPVAFGNKAAVAWLTPGKSAWFDQDRTVLFISQGGREGSAAEWKLVQHTAPAQEIIAKANSAAEASTVDAIETLEQLIAGRGLRGLQYSHVMAHKAYLLRLAGRRDEARKIVEQIKLSPDNPLPIVHLVLVTSAMLCIDKRDYEAARARLAEAAAILSRKSAWKSDDLQRRMYLAEVTRETARSILDDAYDAKQDPRDNCFALELAWSMYLEALALVTEDEDHLGHAWIHANLGSLITTYARHSAGLAPVHAGPSFFGLNYPAISRYRGRAESLYEASYRHFGEAERLFQRESQPIVRREGIAWTRYHKIQTDLQAAPNRTREKSRAIIEELLDVGREFKDIAEGKGIVLAEAFHLAHELGDERAAEFGTQAVKLLSPLEKHENVISKVRAKLLTKEG